MEATTEPTHRHDGWTPERKRRFLDLLTSGLDVRRACAGVGLSRQAAYRLRRRDAAFSREWSAAQRAARICAEEAFLAMLPERLLRTMSALSGECELRGAGKIAQDSVRVVAEV